MKKSFALVLALAMSLTGAVARWPPKRLPFRFGNNGPARNEHSVHLPARDVCGPSGAGDATATLTAQVVLSVLPLGDTG